MKLRKEDNVPMALATELEVAKPSSELKYD